MKDIDKYKLGITSLGSYCGRIIIPVYDDRDKLIFWTARAFSERGFISPSSSNETPKYLHPHDVSKDGVLFKTFKGKVDKMVLVEGPFGAIRVSKLFPAAATFGKLNTEMQLRMVTRACNRVVVLYDADALKEGLETRFKLQAMLPTKVVFLKNKTQPDSMTVQQLKEAMSGAF